VAAPEASRIAERAYDLYVQRDRQDGRPLEDWLKAEQQLLEAAGHK
jgi:outer membrane protein TolC